VQLRTAETRLAQAQRLANLGYWETDIQNDRMWWSEALCGMFGVSPRRDGWTFKEFLECVHPDDRNAVRQAREDCFSARAPCEILCRIVRPDGAERMIHVRAEIDYDAKGDPVRGHGMIQDVTEIKRLEQTLRESEEKYRAIFEQVPVGVALIGPDRRFLVANPAWERMSGYTGEELANLSTHDITHPEDVASSTRFFEQVMRGEQERPVFEKRYLRKNGEVLWARVNAVVVRGADGHPRFRLAIVEDISAEKEAGRRRADLQQQQRQALVREVHHRIKNTLQGVAGLLERHAAVNSALGPAIDEARSRLNALALVHGLQSSAVTAEVNLCNILRGIVDMLQAVSPEQVKFDLPEGFVPIEVAEGESVPVALILNELLTNALKHLDAGAEQAVVSVTLGNSGGVAVIVVRNEPARLPAGFDLDSGAGLGTGLKLAKSLLPAQGATLQLLVPSPGRVEAVLKLSPPILIMRPVPQQGRGPL
jgi:PAS domain S-box-containing protein